MFSCESITAFGSFVVPEVNNMIYISFSLSFTSSYFAFPSFIMFSPSFSIFSNFNTPSFSTLSMHILYLILQPWSIAWSTAVWYFSSYTIASASLLFKSFSISLSVSALSSGTIILPAVVTPKYVMHHSYLLFPITATLFTSDEITFSATFLISCTY